MRNCSACNIYFLGTINVEQELTYTQECINRESITQAFRNRESITND